MSKFKIKLFKEAKEELNSLDGSEKILVFKALSRIEENGDKIGDPLENKRGLNLTGCRKVKLKKPGIRIVYRVNEGEVEIIDIIAIGKRADEEVYKEAYKRLTPKS